MYAYLMYCEDRKTFQCHPSYRTIGRAVGSSRNTIKKYVTGLEQRHLIATVPTTVCTKNGRKRNGSLFYTIRPIEEAKEYYFEQQLQRAEEEPHDKRQGSCLNSAAGTDKKGRVRDENEVL